MLAAMRGEASSDVMKVWLYAGASVLLGTWLSPLLYNMGKALAEVSSEKETNGFFEGLAGLCRKADFPDFFVLGLVGMAAVLFIPFMDSLRGGKTTEGSGIWRIRLPQGAKILTMGQRLVRNPDGVRHAGIGFLLAVSLFALLGCVLLATGVLQWKQTGGGISKLFFGWLPFALGLAALQELLFRGITMGIFLRAMRPASALGLSAVLFALVHFLKPPPGLDVSDPDAARVGFELLGKIIGQFAEPRILLGSFAPLLALGVVLAYARWRTASLWLPIGLHAGWIFINQVFGTLSATSDPDSVLWVISGVPLRQGLVPLIGIVIVGVLATYLTTPKDEAPDVAS
jgi:membrane protease YdiL (CAAX protease family)